MPRILSVGLNAAVDRKVTEPGVLVEIEAQSGTLRYSTRGTLSYDGQTWLGGASVSGVGEGGLESRVTLSLPNADNAASALALSDLLRDTPVTIYAYHGVAGEVVVDYATTGSLGENSTFVQALAGFVADHEGILHYRKVNEPRFEGLRRVENLLPTTVNFETASGYSQGNCTVSGKIVTVTGTGSSTTVYTLPSASNVSREGKSPTVRVRVRYLGPSISSTFLTTGFQSTSTLGKNSSSIITAPVGEWLDVCGSGAATFDVGSTSHRAVLYWGWTSRAIGDQWEIDDCVFTVGEASADPPEYVSVGVLSAPYHGANVDGVKYFPYENGNTVASGIVTEGTGAAIAGGKLVLEPEATNAVLQSNNNTAAGGWAVTNATATFDQVGIFGASNSATLVTDSSTSAYGLLTRSAGGTLANGQVFTTRLFVKKATSAPAYTGLLRVTSSVTNNYVDLRFDYYTGQTRTVPYLPDSVYLNVSATTEDYGNWWAFSIECTVNNVAGVTTSAQCYPTPASTLLSSYAVSVTGSATIGNFEQYKLPIEQVRTLPPIITTTTAVTRSADSLTYGTVAANNRTRAVVDGVTLDIDDWSGTMDSAVLGADLAGEISSLSTYGAYAEELSRLLVDSVNDVALEKVTFSLATASEAASHLPDILIGPPLCSHIPAPGTKLTWRGTVYTLEN